MRIVSMWVLIRHIVCVVLVLSALGYLVGDSFGYISHGIWWGIVGGFSVYLGGKKYVP